MLGTMIVGRQDGGGSTPSTVGLAVQSRGENNASSLVTAEPECNMTRVVVRGQRCASEITRLSRTCRATLSRAEKGNLRHASHTT